MSTRSTKPLAITAPAPWRITQDPGSTEAWILDADDNFVCAVGNGDEQTWDVVFANARLIRTAPKLLDACAQASIYFEKHGNDHWMKFMKKAIAEAEGRA